MKYVLPSAAWTNVTSTVPQPRGLLKGSAPEFPTRFLTGLRQLGWDQAGSLVMPILAPESQAASLGKQELLLDLISVKE